MESKNFENLSNGEVKEQVKIYLKKVMDSDLIFKRFEERAKQNCNDVEVLLWQKHKNRSLFEENSYIEIIGWANALLLMWQNHWQLNVTDKQIEIVILLFVRGEFFLCVHKVEKKHFAQFETYVSTQILN